MKINVSNVSQLLSALESARAATEEYEICLAPGIYPITETIVIDGPANAALKISGGKEAVISGFRPLTGWVKEGNCYTLDCPAGSDIRTLYAGSTRLPVSCSEGFEPIESDKISNLFYELLLPDDMLVEDLVGSAWLKIIPSYPWAFNLLDIGSCEDGIIHTTASATYAMKKCHNFIDNMSVSAWLENSKAFLTEGTWCVDRRSRKLYLCYNELPEDLRYPGLQELIRIERDNVTLDGLTFEGGERHLLNDSMQYAQHEWEAVDYGNALVRLRNASHCAVTSCLFRDCSNTALRLDRACAYNLISGNEICNIGGTGIFVGGYGAGTKNVSHHNKIEHNHIHHIGNTFPQSIGIYAWHSSHNHIYRNKVHHTGYIGIVVGGSRPEMFSVAPDEPYFSTARERRSSDRETLGPVEKWKAIEGSKDAFPDHAAWYVNLVENMVPYQHTEGNLIEENDLSHCVQLMSDGNGIYLSDTSKGNIVRGNYVHDMDGLGGQQAIRTDEFLTGTLVENNVVYRCNGGGINLKHYGNSAVNNLIWDIRTVRDDKARGDVKTLFFGYFSLVCVLDSQNLAEEQKIHIKDNILIMEEENQTFYRVGNSDGGVLEDQINAGRLDQCVAEGNRYYATTRQEAQAAFVEHLRSSGFEKNPVWGDPRLTIVDDQVVALEDSPLTKFPQITKI